MTVLRYINLVCLLALAASGCITPDDLIDSLGLEDSHVKEAFNALDLNNDDLITMEDLEAAYFHNDSKFARKKFLEMVDSPFNKDSSVDVREMKHFIEKKPVKLAVFECIFVRSRSLRKFCFVDQILTYIYLVLDQSAIKSFFTYLESKDDKDKLLCYDEVKNIEKIMPFIKENDIDNFLYEIGKFDKRISMPEFVTYVEHEDLQYLFRVCRLTVDEVTATYNNTCLTIELMRYTMHHLTEIDIATLFDDLDEDGNRYIKSHEVMKATNCKPDVAKRFIDLMDENRNSRITFGEFRKYVRLHTVKFTIEQECIPKHEDEDEEFKCYKNALMKLVSDNHTPIWLTVPDLDMLLLFEELDYTDNGKIHALEDLVQGKQWDEEVATKLVKEMVEYNKKEDFVSFYAFTVYVSEPHFVYGLSECMTIGNGMERVTCYSKKTRELIKVAMTKKEAEEFFEYYDTEKTGHISKEQFIAKGIDEENVDYVVRELAMGDKKVTKKEFLWFVRQYELGIQLKVCKSIEGKHKALLTYLSDVMTEYNIQQVFGIFDKDGDREITQTDFLDDYSKMNYFSDEMDKDNDKSVNFLEFWVYLNTPHENPRKRQLEDLCTKKFSKEEQELQCYTREIFNIQ